MAEIPGWLLVHTVQAEAYTGTGARGTTYDTAAPVACFQEDSRRVVRGPDGQEVVSEATLYCRLDQAPKLVEKSRVTLTSGRVATVLLVKPHTDGDLGAPQHLEVNLT